MRSVNGVKEVDLTIWFDFDNLSEVVLGDKVTLRETDMYWFLYVANEEGVFKITEFANGIGGLVRRPQLRPFLVTSGVESAENREIVISSLKDNEKAASKLHLLKLVGVVCENNPVISGMLEAAAVRGSNMSFTVAPPGFLLRVGVYLNSTHSNVKAIQTQNNLLWFLLTGRYSDSLVVPASGTRDSVTFTELSDSPMSNIDSAAGLANLWDCFLRVLNKFRGNAPSVYCLQECVSSVTTALRDCSHEKGALGSINILYLQALMVRLWVSLGLLFEDAAKLSDSAEDLDMVNTRMRGIFTIDADALEHDVTRHTRMLATKRKALREESGVHEAAKKKPSTSSHQGGGGGRPASRPIVPTAGGQGGRGARGGRPIPGRVIGVQGPGPPASGICVTNLQHILINGSACTHNPCRFLHSTVGQTDRAVAKSTVTRVVRDQGTLAALMVPLNDVALKFLNE